ncbi:MAG: hypothetical protein Q8S44_04690 [Flavobacteriaceae bacterium]|nr:hypothetical protein [Flavobacteriaceae bacterium]
MTFKSPTKTDIYGYAFLLFVFAIGIYTSNSNMNFFENVFAREDGSIEYATAFMLLCISLLQLYRFFKLSKYKGYLWQIGMMGFVVLFFFGAGEEISWGQRIFNIETSEYFLENNAQQEMNLHNMVVDGTKINKLIFSQLLTIILVIYLIIIPVLYQNFGQLKNLMAKFAMPLPHWHQSLAFVVVSVIMFIIPSSKKWELYELAFGVIFFLIFLNPYNIRIYSKTE